MNKRFSLACECCPNVVLRTIQVSDQENLREWKNENRKSFFYQEIIRPDDQKKWFSGYLAREQDYMFIVEVNDTGIGCMGIRLLSIGWDIYNVILGSQAYRGKGHMGRALQMMCNYALSLQPGRVTAKVINSNPALNWYLQNGFYVASVKQDHSEIDLNQDLLAQLSLSKKA